LPRSQDCIAFTQTYTDHPHILNRKVTFKKQNRIPLLVPHSALKSLTAILYLHSSLERTHSHSQFESLPIYLLLLMRLVVLVLVVCRLLGDRIGT
jgi:hypothetical protein